MDDKPKESTEWETRKHYCSTCKTDVPAWHSGCKHWLFHLPCAECAFERGKAAGLAALREENAKLKAQAERAEHGWSGCDILRTEAYERIRRLRDVLESAPKPVVHTQETETDEYVDLGWDYSAWFHGPRAEALK